MPHTPDRARGTQWWNPGRLAPPRPEAMPTLAAEPWWSLPRDVLLQRLGATADGLSAPAAATRLAAVGPNRVQTHVPVTLLRALVRQLRDPILLLLLFAAGASAFTGDWVQTSLVLSIVAATVGLTAWREYAAESAAAELRRRLRAMATVHRDGRPQRLPVEDLVPGDVVQLAAGDLVPADLRLIDANELFVNEAVLTGEGFPVRKDATAACDADATIGERLNSAFLGTNVRSGTARALVVATGRAAAVGAIAHRLQGRAPEAEFERGLRRFGYLLTGAMLAMAFVIFGVHMLGGRPVSETLLFAIALALGLSPELLPAILAVNLARGAQRLAKAQVLVRRLDAIENLGSMDVLCTDKTGTLTEGVVRLHGAFKTDGQPSAAVLELAAINAALQTGIVSPLDEAILAAHTPDLSGRRAVGELPFDFIRKRVTVAVQAAGRVQLVTLGAFEPVLTICTQAGGKPLDEATRAALLARYETWTGAGTRVLGLATRDYVGADGLERDAEADLDFTGFVTFLDEPKPDAGAAIASLAELGVRVVVISGDSGRVTAHLAAALGLPSQEVLTGRELARLDEAALDAAVERVGLFAEVDPSQKERIIRALRRCGHVVGFLGDGVNDAPAMHAADTGLSVEGAVDVARDAADFVLLERSLGVIRDGILEGRRTFANTMKYVMTTTSANLGNMASMALVSLPLPFLPLTAGQILLNNFLSDVPSLGIAQDRVDPEMVERPQRWDIRYLGRFMVEFGALSSVFDLLTFAVLRLGFAADAPLFRSGWFVESLLTELCVALVIRSRRPLGRSRPGRFLLVSTAVLVPFTLLLPYLPPARYVGLTPLPLEALVAVVGISASYVLATEWRKRRFFARWA